MTKRINDDELVDVAGGADLSIGVGDGSGDDPSGQKKGGGRTGGGAGSPIDEQAPPSGGSSGVE